MRLYELIEDKIKFYFHGSKIEDIEILEPKPTKLLDRPVVFSATTKGIAISMAGQWDDTEFEWGRDVSSDEDPETVPYTMKELKPGMFKKYFSEPIYLYYVDSKYFHEDDNIQDFERVSFEPVEVLKSIEIKDPLKFMERSDNLILVPFL